MLTVVILEKIMGILKLILQLGRNNISCVCIYLITVSGLIRGNVTASNNEAHYY